MSEEREQIEAELAAITPGPWETWEEPSDGPWFGEWGIGVPEEVEGVEGDSSALIATHLAAEDARFIANAPAHVRSLLGANDTLRTALIEAQLWIEGQPWYRQPTPTLARIREALEGTA